MAGVVREAAARAGWGSALPAGRGRGIAFQFSHLGYAAVVIEVTVSPEGELSIDRAVVAADVGSQILNLSGAENQSEGSVVDGISSSLLQRITIEGGRVVQTGFADMPLLRIGRAPRKIETHFVITDNPPTGLGEPIIPPVPAALGNAIFAATGKRIRDLPLDAADLSVTADPTQS
jgi:isoquinoline 1-oxidoreductase beta subunit